MAKMRLWAMPEIFLPALTAPAIFKFYKMKAGSNEANGSLAWFAVVGTLTNILLAANRYEGKRCEYPSVWHWYWYVSDGLFLGNKL